MIQKTIRVHPSVDVLDARLREGMAKLTPVSFVSCADIAECRDGEAVISLSGDGEVIGKLTAGNLRCFDVAGAVSREDAVLGGSRTEFAKSERLERLLRGRALAHRQVAG